jgi:hypothetical protein
MQNPEKAARKLLEIANATDAPQEGRIHIEKINGPFLFTHGATPTEYKAGLDLAIARGWLVLHESGTFVTFTPAGAELFAQPASDTVKNFAGYVGRRTDGQSD